MKNVTQVDVLEEYSIFLVLSDRILYTFALEMLDSEGVVTDRGRKTSHANFIKVGTILGQGYVCCVKPNTLSYGSNIKVYKPDIVPHHARKPGVKKKLDSDQGILMLYKVSLDFPLQCFTQANETSGNLRVY